MKITTQDIGAFFRALGEQMIHEGDVCAGAVMDTPSSRKEIIERMTNRKRDGDYTASSKVAASIVKSVSDGGTEVIGELYGAFGEYELPV